MSIKEAAEALGVSAPHIYTLEKRGELRIERNPYYAKHARVRIPREDIDALLAKRHHPQ